MNTFNVILFLILSLKIEKIPSIIIIFFFIIFSLPLALRCFLKLYFGMFENPFFSNLFKSLINKSKSKELG